MEDTDIIFLQRKEQVCLLTNIEDSCSQSSGFLFYNVTPASVLVSHDLLHHPVGTGAQGTSTRKVDILAVPFTLSNNTLSLTRHLMSSANIDETIGHLTS